MSRKRSRSEDAPAQLADLVPRLEAMPLDASKLEVLVSNALKTAEAALHYAAANASDIPSVHSAKDAADAARESTFSHIERLEPEYNGAYAAAGLQYAAALIVEAWLPGLLPASRADAARAALRALDLAMLRGGVDDWGRPAETLVRAAHCILNESMRDENHASSSNADDEHRPTADEVHANRNRMEQGCTHFVAGASRAEATSIPRVDARTLTLADFEERFMRTRPAPTPVILTHAIDEWPAVRRSTGHKWSTAYLRRIAGGRLVPVETYADEDATSTYLSESWDRKVITLADYIDQYVDKSANAGGEEEASGKASGKANEETAISDAAAERGYLAQHPLFDQIPTLRDDIDTPDFCRARSQADDSAPDGCEVRNEPIVSAWIGPAGTVSPLHNDPFHNLLAQVVGSKYVRLIDARQTPRLYPRSGALCNNSHVNLDKPTPKEHPKFEGTPFWHCVLGPSEVLYIPRLCWHYVRSLEVSMSVSFWWGARMALTCNDDGTVEERY